MKLATILIFTLLTGCNSVPVTPDVPRETKPISPKTALADLKQLTHADLQAAAAYADKNGYPARAAMWTALEAQLTAAEAQVKACADAIRAALPTGGLQAPAGAFTAIEMAAEAVGQGVPASVRINCAPIPLPAHLLPVPGLP